MNRPIDALDAETRLTMLRRMMLIRRFEQRCAQSYQQAKIGGFCHLYIGQEAVAVGTVFAVNQEDPIVTAYRDHGHALARGMWPGYCMAEMFGKLTGCAKGKGGSMHMFDKPNHMYGGHAIVGGQCPLGVGLAFALQYNQEDKVCLCYLGDGALNQGAFHESMNLAAIWDLPIVFILENNMYSMGTHIARGTSAAEDLSVKADSYGMRFGRMNGMDLEDVYAVTKEHADRARAGEGPAFLDCQTYRYQGHSMSDPQKYRTKDEVAKFEEQDAIDVFTRRLVEQGVATQEQIDEMDGEAKQAAVDAVKYAESSPETPLDELYTDVFTEPIPPYRRGSTALILEKPEGDIES